MVRYQLQVTNDPAASDAGDNVLISDNIPTNSSYQSGTIKLNGVLQTDAAGDDAGEFTGAAIKVNTGVLNPGDTATIEYDITVN